MRSLHYSCSPSGSPYAKSPEPSLRSDMIEINLLPGGGGRKARSRGGGGGLQIDLKGMIASITGRFTDKYLLAAVGSAAVAAVMIGMLYTRQTYRAVTLAAAEEQAVKDSTRLAIALAEKIKAEATRD